MYTNVFKHCFHRSSLFYITIAHIRTNNSWVNFCWFSIFESSFWLNFFPTWINAVFHKLDKSLEMLRMLQNYRKLMFMNKDDFTIFYFISFVSFPFPSSILLKRFSHMNTGFIYPSWTHPSPHTGYISVQSVQGTQSTLVSRVYLICVTSVKRTMWNISKQQSIVLCHTVINWITSQHKTIL